jgi:GAF domain-containing protein
MAGAENQAMRFLQQECARLKDENELLSEEVRSLRRYVGELSAFQETAQEFTPEQDVVALLGKTLGSALDLLDCDDGSVSLVDEETDELLFVLVHGAAKESLQGHRIGRQEGIVGWAIENREPAIVNDVDSDPRFLRDLDEAFGFVTLKLICVPLTARGRTLGALEVINKRSGNDFTEEDAGILSVLASLAASALDYAASAPLQPQGKT